MTGRLAAALGAVAIAAGTAFALLILPPQLGSLVASRFAAALPPGTGLTYAAASYDVFARALTLEDARLTTVGGGSAHADQVTVRRGSGEGTPASPFKAAEIVASGVSIGGDEATRIALTEVWLAADHAADAFGDPSPLRRLITLLTVGKASRAEIRDFREPDGASVARIAADALGDGRIGRILLEGVQVAQPVLRTDRLEAADVDAAGLAAVFEGQSAPVRPSPAPDRRRLIGTADWAGLETDDGETHVHVARLQLGNLTARPPRARGDGRTRGGDRRSAPALLGSLAFDRVSLDGINAETRRQQPVVMALNRLVLSDYAFARLGECRLETFRMSVPGQADLAANLLQMRGLDAATLLREAMDGEEPRNGPGGAAFSARRNSASVKLPFLDLQGASVAPANGPTVTLAGLLIETDYDGDRLAGLRQSLRGLVVPLEGLDLAPERRAQLQAFGMGRIGLDVDLGSRADAGKIWLEVLELKLDALGSLRLAGEFSRLDPDKLAAGDYVGAFSSLTLERFDGRYEDHSLVGRMLAVSALQSGATADALRTTLSAQVQTSFPSEFAPALAGFLRQPGVLSATAAPPTPVPVLSLVSLPADRWAAVLGLRLKTE